MNNNKEQKTTKKKATKLEEIIKTRAKWYSYTYLTNSTVLHTLTHMKTKQNIKKTEKR